MNRSTRRTQVIAGSLLAAALVAGGGLAIAGTAVAAEPTASSTASSSTDGTADGTADDSAATVTAPDAAVDESTSQRSDEQLLTGTDAEKATAAALAAYPGATIQRVETDSEGVYEAHLITADGTVLIVQMDAAFAVTGTQERGGHGGARGPGGRGPADGSTTQPDASTSTSGAAGA